MKLKVVIIIIIINEHHSNIIVKDQLKGYYASASMRLSKYSPGGVLRVLQLSAVRNYHA